MTLIEGVGDEVVQFMGVVLLVVVSALAWWSTNARPDRYRTVLVMRTRAHQIGIRPRIISVGSSSNTISAMSSTPEAIGRLPSDSRPTRANPSGMASSYRVMRYLPIPQEIGVSTSTSSRDREGVGSTRQNPRRIPLQEMDSIVDADMAMMNHHRLHFYRRVDTMPARVQSIAESTSDESETQDELEPSRNLQMREMDSIVSAMEADSASDPFVRPLEPNSPNLNVSRLKSENSESTSKKDKITESEVNENAANGEVSAEATSGGETIVIKLKYLNDTQKEVVGSLDELLKDFKCRHFSSELSSSLGVKLIYQGRVLSEVSTLRALGLRSGCVVHALVSQRRHAHTDQRSTTEETSLGEAIEGVGAGGGEAAGGWDLENILMTILSLTLTMVWFFRCEYSNMFTTSASVALLWVTVLYGIAIFSLYFSDTFHFERRPHHAQPVPNN